MRTRSKRFVPLLSGLGFLLLGALIARGLAAVSPAEQPPRIPVVTDARTCAALAAYLHSETSEDWSYLATIARTVLNQYSLDGAGPDCGKGLASALSGEFTPRRWQLALDVVDTVRSGDYSIAPDACARADRIIPLDSRGLPTSPSDAAAAERAQCVIRDLAFVGAQA